jgi:hypothetical protein
MRLMLLSECLPEFAVVGWLKDEGFHYHDRESDFIVDITLFPLLLN